MGWPSREYKLRREEQNRVNAIRNDTDLLRYLACRKERKKLIRDYFQLVSVMLRQRTRVQERGVSVYELETRPH